MILLKAGSWEIITTKHKGRGIFAMKDLNPGIIAGDYIGKVIRTATEDTSEKNGLYLLYYHDYASIYPLDLEKPGIHLMNHSCAPNCGITIYKGHTLFFTLRKIFAGEELTVSYQLSPDDYCNPCLHQCTCGFNNCRGTMHLTKENFSKWNTYITNETLKTRRARIAYGKPLKQLPVYPECIEDNEAYDLFGSTEKAAKTLKYNKLPATPVIRELLRRYGQILYFPMIDTTILGIQNGEPVIHV